MPIHTLPIEPSRPTREGEESFFPAARPGHPPCSILPNTRLLAKDGPALPAVETLRRVWVQQFHLSAEGVRWRTTVDGIPPAATFLSLPYDPDAHLGRKRTTKWAFSYP